MARFNQRAVRRGSAAAGLSRDQPSRWNRAASERIREWRRCGEARDDRRSHDEEAHARGTNISTRLTHARPPTHTPSTQRAHNIRQRDRQALAVLGIVIVGMTRRTGDHGTTLYIIGRLTSSSLFSHHNTCHNIVTASFRPSTQSYHNRSTLERLKEKSERAADNVRHQRTTTDHPYRHWHRH